MATKYYGKQECGFEPNVRIVLKRKSVFIQPVTIDASSPLFGKIESGTDDSSGYDERKYKNSVLRHSTLFERMREMRKNIEKADGFYDGGELYSDTHETESGETELYCDGRLEIDGDGKTLFIDNDEELIFEENGILRWRSSDPFCPELVFENGKRISHAYFPHLDFLLKLGAEPELIPRSCVTTFMCDGITEKGGVLSLEYVVELGGVEFENTKLTLAVYPAGL